MGLQGDRSWINAILTSRVNCETGVQSVFATRDVMVGAAGHSGGDHLVRRRALLFSAFKAATPKYGLQQEMSTALFVNGMFEDVLDRIHKIQQAAPATLGYLQPYAAGRIKLLAEANPSTEYPITAYFSLTGSLATVSYRANIVGWHDKRDLAKNLEVFNKINLQIKESQQAENGLYLTTDDGKPCVNLISVTDVEPLKAPFPVSCLIKTGDGRPLKKRTRAGGWSPVREPLQWLGMISQAVKDDVDADLRAKVSNSMNSNGGERQQRLAAATKFPEPIQVVSRAFRRNPDVIAEILIRAIRICEECYAPAPFYRASDNTPYLEVHHRKMLSEGGEDSVANAMAVCPNCHRKLHFGKTVLADQCAPLANAVTE